MNCLNCNTEMTNNLIQTKKDEIAYDICESCGSLWLDAGELDKIAYQVSGSIEFCTKDKVEGILEKSKKCSRCNDTIMDKVSFIGMMLSCWITVAIVAVSGLMAVSLKK